MSGRSIGSFRRSSDLRSGSLLGLAAVVGSVAVMALDPTAPRARAADEEGRSFGVVDLSSRRAPEPLRLDIERWAAERGLKKLPDARMRRALTGPEPAGVAMARLVGAARAKQDGGDCAGAVTLAGEAEVIALGGLTVDEERDPLKRLYVLQIACEHQIGHAEQARAAGARLRTLVSLPPSGLPPPLWELYVAPPPPPASPPPAPVELRVDSDPPNARVAINFHFDGVTPRTLKVPPGVVIVEVEKDGYKKAFRKLTVGRDPARVTFALADRRQDRAEQVEGAVASLRGSDPTRNPTLLARVAELARVDVLVAIAANAGTVKMWWFDADRGDLVGAPVESRFDPKTGNVELKAQRSSR
jgi:hypothetical protein